MRFRSRPLTRCLAAVSASSPDSFDKSRGANRCLRSSIGPPLQDLEVYGLKGSGQRDRCGHVGAVQGLELPAVARHAGLRAVTIAEDDAQSADRDQLIRMREKI